jgi:hypothetical protein
MPGPNKQTDAPIVILETSELMLAGTVGLMREVTNLRDERQDAYGASPEKGWQLHIEGCCGELAVAKFLNLFWSGQLGKLHADDVGFLQVRTRSKDHYDLMVHPEDPDDKVFILAIGLAPKFRLAGWMYGRDAKQKRWWDDPAGDRPAYFVKQSWLNPMSQLVELLRGKNPTPLAPPVEMPPTVHPF